MARELERVAGPQVVIRTDTVDLFDGSRSADFSPHWGGAALSLTNPPIGGCTAGFTVNVKNGGGRGSVTAGHCFENGETLFSGPYIYGVTEGKTDFPAYDMILIRDAGIPFTTYTNKIHVDPCCPTVRNVTSSASVALNALVCVSGRLSKAKCGAKVISLNGVFCQTGGCTTSLIVANKPGVVLGQVGDSGAPVYTQSGANNAVINGMLIGGNLTGDTIYAEKISNIEPHLGVTVRTTP